MNEARLTPCKNSETSYPTQNNEEFRGTTIPPSPYQLSLVCLSGRTRYIIVHAGMASFSSGYCCAITGTGNGSNSRWSMASLRSALPPSVPLRPPPSSRFPRMAAAFQPKPKLALRSYTGLAPLQSLPFPIASPGAFVNLIKFSSL